MQATLINAREHFGTATDTVSTLARGLSGSEILKIAADIRAMVAAGESVCNLTVGDFSPKEFPIPEALASAITAAIRAGQTNYPPSDGIPELRREVMALYERTFGLSYPLESVLIAGGSRPVIYGTYKTIVDPGDAVMYPVPSWNNNHYCFLSSAERIEIPVDRTTNFFPTAEMIRPHIHRARLLCINTPLNPTGTAMSRDEVGAIAALVVEENERRKKTGERPLYLMWDQVYWMLTFGQVKHYTPPQLVPASAEWTIFVDGISKALAATGVRVGWAVGAPQVISRMRDMLGHVGAWAPRAEQAAVAAFLPQTEALETFRGAMVAGARERLELLHEGFQAMRREGLPVDSIEPQGAIYLSARFDLIGRRFEGHTIDSNEAIRRILLQHAHFAVVPFQAFGSNRDDGWMRLSIGAVSPADIREALPRVRAVLDRVSSVSPRRVVAAASEVESLG